MAHAHSTGHRLHFRQALLPSGWACDVRVAIDDGIITAVTSGTPPLAGDSTHAIGLPGMPNLHSHAFQRGMAGLAEVRGPQNDSFWSWREIMYRFVERLEPASLHAIAALAYMEMLEAGFTRVGEFHYLHHAPDGTPYDDPAELSQAIFAAAEETGIAITHLPVFYAHSGFGGARPNTSQRRFINDLDGYNRLIETVRSASGELPDAVVGIAPHSLRAVTEAELRVLDSLA
ncbi:MAG: formimidoylglutamate deiminase, partial [Hyphomicrobiales bacterium]